MSRDAGRILRADPKIIYTAVLNSILRVALQHSHTMSTENLREGYGRKHIVKVRVGRNMLLIQARKHFSKPCKSYKL